MSGKGKPKEMLLVNTATGNIKGDSGCRTVDIAGESRRIMFKPGRGIKLTGSDLEEAARRVGKGQLRGFKLVEVPDHFREGE